MCLICPVGCTCLCKFCVCVSSAQWVVLVCASSVCVCLFCPVGYTCLCKFCVFVSSAQWVGRMASLDGCGKTRLHRDQVPGPSSPYRVAIPRVLSQPTFSFSVFLFLFAVFLPLFSYFPFHFLGQGFLLCLLFSLFLSYCITLCLLLFPRTATDATQLAHWNFWTI